MMALGVRRAADLRREGGSEGARASRGARGSLVGTGEAPDGCPVAIGAVDVHPASTRSAVNRGKGRPDLWARLHCGIWALSA